MRHRTRAPDRPRRTARPRPRPFPFPRLRPRPRPCPRPRPRLLVPVLVLVLVLVVVLVVVVTHARTPHHTACDARARHTRMTRTRITNARDCARHPPRACATNRTAPRPTTPCRAAPCGTSQWPRWSAHFTASSRYTPALFCGTWSGSLVFSSFFRCRAWAHVPAAGYFLARKHKKRFFGNSEAT